MKQINYNEYISLLKEAIANNSKVALNCSLIDNDVSRIYLKSEEGCSFLSHDYFLGGLFRFKEGNENLTSLHQQERIKLGGYFLECYEGVLSDFYAKNGFKIVSRVIFNPEFAKKGWELDSVLKHKPNVVFMSLYEVSEKYFIRYKNNYNEAYNYAKSSIKFASIK